MYHAPNTNKKNESNIIVLAVDDKIDNLKSRFVRKNKTYDFQTIMSLAPIARCLNEGKCYFTSIKELDSVDLSDRKNDSVTIYLVSHGNPGNIGFSLQDNLSAEAIGGYMKKFCEKQDNCKKLKQVIILACSGKNVVNTECGSNKKTKQVSVSSEVENSSSLLKNKVFALKGDVIASPNKQLPIVSVDFDPLYWKDSSKNNIVPQIAKNIDDWCANKYKADLEQYFVKNIKDKNNINKSDLEEMAKFFGKKTVVFYDERIKTMYMLDLLGCVEKKRSKFLKNEALITDANGNYQYVKNIYEEGPAKNILFDNILWNKMTDMDKELGMVSKELQDVSKLMLDTANIFVYKINRLSELRDNIKNNYNHFKEEHRNGKLVNSEFRKKMEQLLQELNKLHENSNGLKENVISAVNIQLAVNGKLSDVESALKHKQFRPFEHEQYHLELQGLKKRYNNLENGYKNDKLTDKVFLDEMGTLLQKLQSLRKDLESPQAIGRATLTQTATDPNAKKKHYGGGNKKNEESNKIGASISQPKIDQNLVQQQQVQQPQNQQQYSYRQNWQQHLKQNQQQQLIQQKDWGSHQKEPKQFRIGKAKKVVKQESNFKV